MALGVINLRLRKLGEAVMTSVPESARIAIPPKPTSAMLMRLWMMLGMLIIIVGFIIALNVAGTASAVFSNPVKVIDAAASGSELLKGLQTVHAAESWLEAFKFLGFSFLFMGIIQGLATIVFSLKFQKEALPQVVDRL
jgi:hypothetical protein